MNRTAEAVIVGKVVGLFGVKGWLKIRSYTDPRAQIGHYSPWQLDIDGRWHTIEVESVRPQGKGLIAKLTDVDDRDGAVAFIGSEIRIDRTQLPALGEDEFYWRDLVGLTAVNLAQVELGKVTRLFETGAHDVLVVEPADGPEILVPFVLEQTVRSVDLEAGLIRVDWEPDY